MKGSETNRLAVRAFIGMAIRNLDAISFDHQVDTGVLFEIEHARTLLADARERLTASLSKEREGA